MSILYQSIIEVNKIFNLFRLLISNIPWKIPHNSRFVYPVALRFFCRRWYRYFAKHSIDHAHKYFFDSCVFIMVFNFLQFFFPRRLMLLNIFYRFSFNPVPLCGLSPLLFLARCLIYPYVYNHVCSYNILLCSMLLYVLTTANSRYILFNAPHLGQAVLTVGIH